MATATMPRAGDTIKLEYGVPQIACFKWLEGKSVPSQFGTRAMFTAIDSRKLFVDGEDANDIERGMRELGIRPGEDFVRLTKIRHARGGGHSIRVERIEEGRDDAPAWVRDVATAPASRPDMRQPARMPPQPERTPVAQPRTQTHTSNVEALLEKSVELARERGPAAFITPKPDQPAAPAVFTTDAAPMLAAMCAAVDAIVETQAYAQRRGLGVTFSEESVRAIGLSIYIGNQRGTR